MYKALDKGKSSICNRLCNIQCPDASVMQQVTFSQSSIISSMKCAVMERNAEPQIEVYMSVVRLMLDACAISS